MFVVMVLVDEYLANGQDARFAPPCLGVLPVYPTKEDAEKEWPGSKLIEIEKVGRARE